LTTTEQKLQRLREALQSGRVEMDEIQDLSDDIEEAVSKIGDEEARNTLRDMDKASAWLEAWRNRTITNYALSPKVKYQLQNHSRLLVSLRERLLNSTQMQPEKEPTNSTTPSNEGSTNTEAAPKDKDALAP
jgi:hypothetical protein